ncbi:RluA family pseudouridine synthase [Actinomycetospora endophytica]|uniref:RNA pseudouridylate synthase n=1 Tax=Actinomycetospora endophytica TaxID=2291215 RepID=A0ABS8P6Q1_9PSEU|nr:RluA family pseudouridine synthase [Actinomycetospora endophytica]MCD2193922.1 RluA family pseudouridine synthase [Actinomycetospora endophytica]
MDWSEIRASRTLHEDDALLVLDKPAGWSVMGERHDTDLVRIAADHGEKLWPAHRIDKVTSGVVLFAKDLEHHGDLTRQFNARTVEKTYLALTATSGLPESGRIELPLSVGRKNRVRIAAPREAIVRDGDTWTVPESAVLEGVSVYPSTTTFERLSEDSTTLLAVHPETGRRHQIRVHLAWIGYALVGDPLFDKHATTRTGLHAHRLTFDAPDGQRLTITAEPGEDFLALRCAPRS